MGGAHPRVRGGAEHLARPVRDAGAGTARVHLDLYTGDQQAEVDRLVALGASRVDWPDYPEDADFIVLADTEGNRFCVVAKG